MKWVRRIVLQIVLTALASAVTPVPANAQHEETPDPHTLSGYVEDADSGWAFRPCRTGQCRPSTS